jgi:hypothetical protein
MTCINFKSTVEYKLLSIVINFFLFKSILQNLYI